jgi:hypothetical protein
MVTVRLAVWCGGPTTSLVSGLLIGTRAECLEKKKNSPVAKGVSRIRQLGDGSRDEGADVVNEVTGGPIGLPSAENPVVRPVGNRTWARKRGAGTRCACYLVRCTVSTATLKSCASAPEMSWSVDTWK